MFLVAPSESMEWCLANLGASQHREFIEGLIERVVAEAAAKREKQGSMVLGSARLQRQNPHTQPYRNQIS
jgi:hypothetical protein